VLPLAYIGKEFAGVYLVDISKKTPTIEKERQLN